MKDFHDLFVACGGKRLRTREGELISIPEETEPIDIVIQVVPMQIDLQSRTVTFMVLLGDQIRITSGGIQFNEYDVSLELPLEGVKLAAWQTGEAEDMIAELNAKVAKENGAT